MRTQSKTLLKNAIKNALTRELANRLKDRNSLLFDTVSVDIENERGGIYPEIDIGLMARELNSVSDVPYNYQDDVNGFSDGKIEDDIQRFLYDHTDIETDRVDVYSRRRGTEREIISDDPHKEVETSGYIDFVADWKNPPIDKWNKVREDYALSPVSAKSEFGVFKNLYEAITNLLGQEAIYDTPVNDKLIQIAVACIDAIKANNIQEDLPQTLRVLEDISDGVEIESYRIKRAKSEITINSSGLEVIV